MAIKKYIFYDRLVYYDKRIKAYIATAVNKILDESKSYTDSLSDNYDKAGSSATVQTNLNVVDDKVDDHIADSDIHFTSAERTKLAGIANKANNYSHPNSGVTATAAEINKLDGLTATTAQLNKTATLSTVATSGSYTDLSNKPTIPTVYTAAQCTTYTSDSGTVTPLAVQNAAKKFAIPRITSTANAIARYSGTTGEVKNSTIKIEDVTNTKDSSQKAEIIAIPAANGTKKMVYGYCTDQVDGTSFIGGLFDADATAFPYASGLAIGGSSGNLLWKGTKVAVSTDIPTKVSQLTNDSGFKTTDNNTTYTLTKSGSTITLTGSDGSTTSVSDSNTTYSNATTSAAGLMSAADKTKLDGLQGGGGFDFDALINASGYSYTYVKSTGVETIKSGSTTYATRTSTKNASTGVWTVVTVCSAAGVNVTKTYTPSSTGWTVA